MTSGKQKLLVYSLWCERKSMSLRWDTKTPETHHLGRTFPDEPRTQPVTR